jgi:hypothetical protein
LSAPNETTASPQNSVAIAKHHIVAACSAALLGCFFLRWISLLFIQSTGLQLAREDGRAVVFWIVPALALVTLFLSAAKRPYRLVACLAGISPFALLCWGVVEMGADLFKIIVPTGWVTVAVGCVLIFFSRK